MAVVSDLAEWKRGKEGVGAFPVIPLSEADQALKWLEWMTTVIPSQPKISESRRIYKRITSAAVFVY